MKRPTKRCSLALFLFLGLGTLSALSAACSEETVPLPPAPPVNYSPAFRMSLDAGPLKATDLERAAASNYEKALGSPGFSALGPLLNEDAHSAFAGMKDAHGRDKVVEAHEALFGAFDHRRFVVSRVWLTDSSQAIEWTMTGVRTAKASRMT